jgi:tetratricopeptide (TPR) repeat protein
VELFRDLGRQGLDLIRKVIERSPDEAKNGYLWVRLALLQNHLGDRAAARQSLDRAIVAAKTIKQENGRVDLLQFVAYTLADVGDFEDALKKTEILTVRGLHVFALKDIAKGEARAGDLNGARATVTKIKLMASREKREQRSGEPLLAAYDLVRSEVLAEIALFQASSGADGVTAARQTLDEALALINPQITHRPELAGIPLAGIARAQARVGERDQSRRTFERALAVTRGLPSFPGAEITARIGEACWKAGESEQAKKILREAAKNWRSHGGGLPQVDNLIAQTQLEIGDLEGVLETARASRGATGEPVLPDMLQQLVRAQAAAKGARPALAEWFENTKPPVLRAYALLGAAEAAEAPIHQGALKEHSP